MPPAQAAGHRPHPLKCVSDNVTDTSAFVSE